MSFFTSSSKTIKRSSGRRTRSSRQRTGTRNVRTWPTVQLNFGNNVLLAVRQPVPELPALYKVEVGISNLRGKNVQQKKTRPPACKNLSHVSRSRDLFFVWPKINFYTKFSKGTTSTFNALQPLPFSPKMPKDRYQRKSRKLDQTMNDSLWRNVVEWPMSTTGQTWDIWGRQILGIAFSSRKNTM